MKVVFWMLVACALHAQTISDWAFEGPDHRLHYRTDPRGNSIMDFSSAGYRAGGVKLPSAVAAQRLTPAAGDNTARIQAALDQANGAVVLEAGVYELAGTVTIAQRRRAARDRPPAGPASGSPARRIASWRFAAKARGSAEGNSAAIIDPMSPRARSLSRYRGRLSSRRSVLVRRPVTEAWVHFMGMDTLVRDGKQQTWLKAGSFIRTDRVITSWRQPHHAGRAPDRFHRALLNPPGATLVKYTFPAASPKRAWKDCGWWRRFRTIPSRPQFTVLLMDAVIDGWARDIVSRRRKTAWWWERRPSG